MAQYDVSMKYLLLEYLKQNSYLDNLRGYANPRNKDTRIS